MKKLILMVHAIIISLMPLNLFSQQIIANHTIVDRYDDIPRFYINKVKEMWVTIPGESHSSGYRIGCDLLSQSDTAYKVLITESGTPPGYTNQYLRLSRATWGDVGNATGWRYGYGEEDWYTSTLSRTRTKDHITYCNTHNLNIAAMGFGWCWDMTWTNSPGGTVDPVYQVRWAGSSDGGPQGNLRWGLDAGDQALTGNSVCMDTYLSATLEYINHCLNNSYSTKVFFTTGPVDGGGNTGESGYQRHIKHEYIRSYVQNLTNGILFDYADILCWNNAGTQNTVTWTDYGNVLRTFPYIAADNMLDLNGTYTEDGDHIGQRGAVRLAKALWWMLARIAGWDGVSTNGPSLKNDSYLNIFPNPFNEAVNINSSLCNYDLQVLNALGQVILNYKLSGKNTSVDLANLDNGVYFIKLVNGETTIVKRIVKQ